MKKGVAVLLAVLSVGGCSLVNPDYIAAEGRALEPAEAKSGTGFIHSVAVLRGGARMPSASTGSSADPNAYRLFVEMDSGGFQTVDVDSAHFLAGQRVQIASDGRVVAF